MKIVYNLNNSNSTIDFESTIETEFEMNQSICQLEQSNRYTVMTFGYWVEEVCFFA
jgi:hypothetical protein